MFKKKTVEEEPKIEFLTALPGAVELTPPVPMRKAMPEWIRKTPLRCPVPHGNMPPPPGAPPGWQPPPPPTPLNSNVPTDPTTIKACAGIIDLFKWGWMVPLWCDHEITTLPDARQTQRYSARAGITGPHVGTSGFQPFHQEFMPQKPDEFDFSPKLDSPWLIRTPPGYSTALLPIFLDDDEFTKPWRVVPGILDTDRYHNFNVLLKWSFEGRYLLEQGTPMCIVVPFKRSDADMKAEIREITDQEAERLRARGKGGTGSGDRMTTMPYQKWRKQSQK